MVLEMTTTRLLALIALTATGLFAGQVTMKNGDRFTGTVVKLDGKNLVLKSDYAGPISVPWDAVVSISSSEPLSITLQDGQMLIGQVSTSGTRFLIETKNAGTITTERDAVKMLRSQAEQAEADRYLNPRLTDLWAGFLDLGYSAARGNSSTNNLAVSATATRATTRDKIGVYFTSLYASSKVAGKSVLSANAQRGGINYNLNLRPRLFAFGSVILLNRCEKNIRGNPGGRRPGLQTLLHYVAAPAPDLLSECEPAGRISHQLRFIRGNDAEEVARLAAFSK